MTKLRALSNPVNVPCAGSDTVRDTLLRCCLDNRLAILLRSCRTDWSVDELSVEIDQELAAVLLIIGDCLLPGGVSALFLIGLEIGIGISVVHAALPPPEGHQGGRVDLLAGAFDLAVQVVDREEMLAVLVDEDDPLPAFHEPDPIRDRPLMPPGIGPIPIDSRGFVPAPAIRGDDIRIAVPAGARDAIRILVEAPFQLIEVAFVIGIHSHPVDRVLERIVVTSEVEPLVLAGQCETIGCRCAGIAERSVAEELGRRGIRGAVADRVDAFLDVRPQLAATCRRQKHEVIGKLDIADQRILEFADDRMRLMVSHFRVRSEPGRPRG